jgi:hypothetical protein
VSGTKDIQPFDHSPRTTNCGDGSGLTIVTFDNFAVDGNPEDCVPETFAAETSVEVNGKLTVIWGELKRMKNEE